MPPAQLTKASFKNLDTNATIEFMFNPSSYEFTKENVWADLTSKGQDTPGDVDFGGGKAANLTLDLFFDTHTSGKDVRTEYTKKLWDLAMVNPDKKDSVTGKSSPPMLEFRWGSSWSFKAVVASMTQRFTLFLPDGTPTRAEVKVTLKQVKSEGRYPGQNPTSGGLPGHRIHTVEQRETLDIIASREYGDPNAWRLIAEFNRIDDPLGLRPGMILTLPPIEATSP
jgi:nucleoid-associated protein YgaU